MTAEPKPAAQASDDAAYGLRWVGVIGEGELRAQADWTPVEVARAPETSGRASVGPDAAVLPVPGGGVLRLGRVPLGLVAPPAAVLPDAELVHPHLARAAAIANAWLGRETLQGGVVLDEGPEEFGARIEVDGAEWYDGQATCILIGNLGSLFGGVEVFPDARPDDGQLELGIVEGAGFVKWTRILARTAVGNPAGSPFVRVTRANSIKAKLDRKVLYELDGGERSEIKSFKVRVEPRALCVRVPRRGQEES